MVRRPFSISASQVGLFHCVKLSPPSLMLSLCQIWRGSLSGALAPQPMVMASKSRSFSSS